MKNAVTLHRRKDIKTNKEREIYLHKNDQKNPEGNNIQQSGEEEHEDEMGESVEEENEEEEEENEENGSNNFVNSEEKEQEEETCNCFDVLVVDDEEFNVMASQKMMKKLGYGSDAAYNGEECIIFISGNIDGDELKKSLLQIDCVKECLQKPVKIDKYQKIFEKYHKDMN